MPRQAGEGWRPLRSSLYETSLYDDSNWFMECKNDVATREVEEHQVRNKKTKD